MTRLFLLRVNYSARQFPDICGLQDTVTIPYKHLCKPMGSSDSVQIINEAGKSHWITSRMQDNQIFIYDSIKNLNITGLSIDATVALQNLHGDVKSVSFPDVSQQQGSKDCGLFAIAFATSICFGEPPEKVNFRQFLMRKHLHNCLTSRTMSLFPSDKKAKVAGEHILDL